MQNLSMGLIYLGFLAVSGADLLLTLNGMRAGFLREANPFLVTMAVAAHIDLATVMALAKALAACLAFWLAFRCPGILCARALANGAAAPPSSATTMPAAILITLTAATGLLGVVPAAAGHIVHYLTV
jgi:hypothetical protein